MSIKDHREFIIHKRLFSMLCKYKIHISLKVRGFLHIFGIPPSHLNSGPFAKISAKESPYLLIESNYTKANSIKAFIFIILLISTFTRLVETNF